VIKAFYSDTKRTLAQELLYLISIAEVISHVNLVVAFLIIITAVVLCLLRPLNLLTPDAHVVNLRVVKDLLNFVRCKVLSEMFYCLLRSEWVLDVFKPVYWIGGCLMSMMILPKLWVSLMVSCGQKSFRNISLSVRREVLDIVCHWSRFTCCHMMLLSTTRQMRAICQILRGN